MWNNNPNNNNRGGWNNQSSNRRQQFGFGQNQPQTGYVETSMTARSSLSAKVMSFTFFSILAAMAGTFVGAQMNLSFGGGTWLLFFIAEIALIFACNAFRDKMPINFILLYSFAAVTGLSISPLISILFQAGYSDIVYQALGITAGITIALSLYAWTTKRDFSGFAPYLFAGVIGLILVGLLNALLFHSPILHMVYLYAGVVIFSFYMIFDVQRIKKYQDTVGNAVMLALNLYLNIFNLFLFILQILMSFRD
jgi:FtsH-binding integral membrane protein